MRVTKKNIEKMKERPEQKEFCKVEKKIKSATDLETLKREWKVAQKKEAYQSVVGTFRLTKNRDKESFSDDGYLGSKEEFCKGPKVLFVLREANCGEKKEDSYFWFRDDIVNGKSGNSNGILVRRILKIYAHIWEKENKTTDNRISIHDLRGAAYMNLNKRGGKNVVDYRYLKYYVWMYQAFIRKEIELINPEIIICGGTYELLKSIVDQETEEKMIDLKHPSYHFMSDEDYVDEFDKKYKEKI